MSTPLHPLHYQATTSTVNSVTAAQKKPTRKNKLAERQPNSQGLTKNRKIYKQALLKAEQKKELIPYQAELIKLQNWVYDNNKRVMIMFEGRDAA